ncbi:MAG: sulfatase-like hydrolase/transferase [Suilimivivens sp.]
MGNKKKFIGQIGRTLADTKLDFDVKESPSKGKPNVVYIVLDDMGFAQLGCYGSSINTPNIDRLAYEGIRFNNFHTTAICSATRCSLLTGANHHSAGISGLLEFTTGISNNRGGIDPQYATIAEILREYDYRTFAVGKWHLSTIAEMNPDGPYNNWPLGKGFDNYYGFLACQMNQWNPTLTRDNTYVPAPKKASEGYHLSEDLTDKAIEYIYHHEMEQSDQPFFLYLAYGAMHAPHHAPKEYIEKYKGKFDKGWDVIRQDWFETQKRLGVIPQNAELTERNELIPAWDDLTENQKKAYARSMEVFAGYLEHTDAQIGRLVDYLGAIEQLDNTIIVFLSDNGTSPEGGNSGTHNSFTGFEFTEEAAQVERLLRHYDELGDEYSWPHYQLGWANAGNTPFQWYKTWVHNGGVKDPLIIRYPGVINTPGAVAGQYSHVSDVTPTILDILGFEKPESIRGIAQQPLQGKSFKYALEDVKAQPQKTIQYFEMFGNRAIYKNGWKAVVNHAFKDSFEQDEWELYHVEEDYSEKHNVADKYPDKLKELQEEWLIEAGKYNVFPMFPKGFHRTTDEITKNREKMVVPEANVVYKHVILPHENSQDVGLLWRSHDVKAKLNRKTKDEDGVIISKGDRLSGISFYIKDNKLKYTYNLDGEKRFNIESDSELPLGEVEVSYRMELPDGKSGYVTAFINGQEVGRVDIPSVICATSYPLGIRTNKYSSVNDADYQSPFEYKGIIDELAIHVDAVNVKVEDELKRASNID